MTEAEALHELNKALDKLLNKVNVVTAYHRHGNTVSQKMLSELSNRQIEVEERRDQILKEVLVKST